MLHTLSRLIMRSEILYSALLLFLFVLAPGLCWSSVDTSTGPAPVQDAAVLLEEGQRLLEAGKYNEAIYPLKRLVDRHPGSPDYLNAHLLLGEAFLKNNQPAQAVEPLRFYSSTLLRKPDAEVSAVNRARSSLGRAYLALRKYKEAFLVAKEIEKSLGTSEPAGDPDLLNALLIKTHALYEQGKDKKAETSLAAAAKLLSANPPAALAGETHFLQQQLKLRSCSLLPSRGKLTEDQVRAQLSRKGLCLQEALLAFRKVASTGAAGWAEKAKTEILGAFQAYSRNCAAPPEPPVTRTKGRRSPQQLKQYLLELKHVLKADCQEKMQQASSLLSEWAGQSSAEAAILFSETGSGIGKLL